MGYSEKELKNYWNSSNNSKDVEKDLEILYDKAMIKIENIETKNKKKNNVKKEHKYNICDSPGPCWDGYVYIGPNPGEKGSCIKVEKLCKKKTNRAKGFECLNKADPPGPIKCDNSSVKIK